LPVATIQRGSHRIKPGRMLKALARAIKRRWTGAGAAARGRAESGGAAFVTRINRAVAQMRAPRKSFKFRLEPEDNTPE